MGVRYTPILAIGREFENSEEAEAFLRNNSKVLEGVSYSQIYDGGIDEWLPKGMQGGSLNLYTDGGYYLGFHISCRDIESFQQSFDDGVSMWDALFQDHTSDVIHTVRVS